MKDDRNENKDVAKVVGEKKIRVTLEPELEEEVCLMTLHQRKMLLKKLNRWAKQLRISIKILEADAEPYPMRAPKYLSVSKRVLN